MRLAVIALSCVLSATLFAADPAPKKLELYLMLPEPRSMGTSISKPWAQAKRTVFTPAKQVTDKAGIKAYAVDEFTKLGISWDRFLEKAKAAAEKRLATMQPELKKDETGKIAYAVYRSDEPTVAGLLIAPSLAKVFEKVFGKEVWALAPDRNSLFIFPAGGEALRDFAGDLKERFDDNPYAASDEIYELKSDDSEPRVVGNFTNR